jgi:hypothetical protein
LEAGGAKRLGAKIPPAEVEVEVRGMLSTFPGGWRWSLVEAVRTPPAFPRLLSGFTAQDI